VPLCNQQFESLAAPLTSEPLCFHSCRSLSVQISISEIQASSEWCQSSSLALPAIIDTVLSEILKDAFDFLSLLLENAKDAP
jgi:hypothetical protein